MAVEQLDSLAGQVAIVTGANRGIGAQVAIDLAGFGATVFAGARDPSALAGIEQESNQKIRPVGLDVQDEASIEAAVAHAVNDAGRLDIVVNNAAIGDFKGTALADVTSDKLDAVWSTNVRGPALVAKHALPHLLEQPGSRIVNVSSGMGALSSMGGTAPAYRISKTALNGLTAYLNGEYGPRGLVTASVCPGWVRTDMGGPNARRSVEEGAASVVHACRLTPNAPSGLFWRDGQVIDW